MVSQQAAAGLHNEQLIVCRAQVLFILNIFYGCSYMRCINDNQGYGHCIAGYHLAISAATF
eukprot:1071504-Pleurochrysis_carterae.AAC.1